jgi:hypothetical protein
MAWQERIAGQEWAYYPDQACGILIGKLKTAGFNHREALQDPKLRLAAIFWQGSPD